MIIKVPNIMKISMSAATEYKEPVPGNVMRRWNKLRKKHPNKSKQIVIARELNAHRNTIHDAFGNRKATPTMRDRITAYLEALEVEYSKNTEDGN